MHPWRVDVERTGVVRKSEGPRRPEFLGPPVSRVQETIGQLVNYGGSSDVSVKARWCDIPKTMHVPIPPIRRCHEVGIAVPASILRVCESPSAPPFPKLYCSKLTAASVNRHLPGVICMLTGHQR
ncbi:hypothetical protein PAXINDRAFT_172662 [Paxillus involutus ATCC 200175]|uniref:Unplaced genomic scaffold PAXINscaffold_196, whole genome shotgun sequence n=1 Tax=Paxillus involutus ATCC 200175 TaxID=664439 RepID=A0A0C9TPA9_PAXIN|nr:hypothetical protein PAXINDRAFT_172662 [Paxillus involutus ATCC 200175]